MYLIIGLASSLIVSALAFFLGRSLGSAHARALTQQELQLVRSQLADSEKNLAVAETAFEKEGEKYREKLGAYNEAEKLLKDAFGALAGSVLESNSRQFLELAETRFRSLQVDTKAELDARKTAIESLVTPLGKSLGDLGQKVSDLEAKRIQAYTEVATQIAELGNANKELRVQTGSLVQALRSPNVRGDWGQMQLRRTVEIAGMMDYCDFCEQPPADTVDGGRLKPDMVVRLPGDRRVVIDAKAPRLYLENTDAKTEEEKSQYLKTHAIRVREHMNQLASKKYWEQFTPTPEFVIMFLPVEALFAAALQQDPTLLEFGAEKRVIPASPLTLIALLRAVNYGWKEASLARDARKIQELGKSLYESVRVLAAHLVKMRDHLEGAVQAFNSSVGSLEHSFLTRARKFKELNAGGTDDILELETIDERLRSPEAPELRQDFIDTAVMEAVVLHPVDRES
jgi:DNA recombination protein RmuC